MKVWAFLIGLTAAAAANAQSSVTLYGSVDGGILIQSSSAASLSPRAVDTGHVVRYKDDGIKASTWGLYGLEDLGSGWKAKFQLQGSFDSGTGKFGLGDTPGVASIFNQFAVVGLSGPYGAVQIGRQMTPMYIALAATDVRGGAYFGSILMALIGINTAAGWTGTSTNVALGSAFDSNAIVYNSPTFAGASLSLEYAPGGVAGSFQGGTRESAVLQYNNYGLKVAAIYYEAHDSNPGTSTIPTGLLNNRFMSIGALYTINDFSVSGTFANARNPAQSYSSNYDIISGGLGYWVSPALQLTSGVYFLRDNNDSSNESIEYVVVANYSLSAATSLYANFGYVKNRGAMNQPLVYAQAVAPGIGTSAAMIGIRHTF